MADAEAKRVAEAKSAEAKAKAEAEAKRLARDKQITEALAAARAAAEKKDYSVAIAQADTVLALDPSHAAAKQRLASLTAPER